MATVQWSYGLKAWLISTRRAVFVTRTRKLRLLDKSRPYRALVLSKPGRGP